MSPQLLNDIWQTVFESIRTHKLRASLTLTGVIVGTAVVALVGAILTGLSQRVADVTEKNSPNVVYFTKEDRIGPSLAQPTAEERQRKDFTYDDILAVAALESPQAVSPQKIRGDYGPTANIPKLTANSRTAINPLILGVWENFPEITSVAIADGRFFTEQERKSRAAVSVIGAGVATQVFEDKNPVGKNVKMDGKLFRVIGVLRKASGEGVIGSDEIDERVVYIPFETSQKFYPEIKENAITVRAPQGKLNEVTEDVTNLLRLRRNVPNDQPNNFGVNRAEQIFTLVNDVISGLSLIIVPIALASLLVGGVGVMNIMLVSVRERAAEIGIRRALGATQKVILIQFLLEATTLTGFGGIVGMLTGLALAFIVRVVVSFPAVVPFWAILSGFGASVAIGLIAGIYPAIRAARLDPVEAMRGN